MAPAVAELFRDTVVRARVVSDEPGAASAVKMAYAAWTKGTAALLLAIRAVARAEGVEATLLDEWQESIPELPARSRARRGHRQKGLAMGGGDGGDRQHVRGGRACRRLPRGCRRDLPAVPTLPSATRAPPHGVVRLEDDRVVLLDQRRLPDEEADLECRDAAEVAEAIRTLAVRGAPAIGVAAAYGYALAAALGHDLDEADRVLRSSRPTAVNLAWALDRMREDPTPERAKEIHAEEVERCRRMAKHAMTLLRPGTRALTHCNTGALATGGYGTALGAIRLGWEQGLVEHVWVTETRPIDQGARLTAWELDHLGIPFAVIADSAAASLMEEGGWTSRSRARTASRQTATRRTRSAPMGSPFSHATTTSRSSSSHRRQRSIPTRESGDAIPIQERTAGEITAASAFNPAFDIAPAGLIDAIVTEEGVRRGAQVHQLARARRGLRDAALPVHPRPPEGAASGRRQADDRLAARASRADRVRREVPRDQREASPASSAEGRRGGGDGRRRRDDERRRPARRDRRHRFCHRARGHRRRPRGRGRRQPLLGAARRLRARRRRSVALPLLAIHDVGDLGLSVAATTRPRSTHTAASRTSRRSRKTRARTLSGIALYFYRVDTLPLTA